MSATANGRSLRERHLGELVGQLGSDAGMLVRKEIELARAEVQERVEEIRDGAADVGTTARAELAVKLDTAKADAGAKARSAASGLGMFGVAAVGALLMLGALTACLILLLHRWLAADLSALIVAAVWGCVAAVGALRGRKSMKEVGGLDPSRYVPTKTIERVKDMKERSQVERLKPQHTIETVKEDVEWAKTRGRSDAR